MGTEEPYSSSSSSSSFNHHKTIIPAPLSAAHFEPTTSLRRASLSAAAQLSLGSPNSAEPKSAPSTPIADHQRPRDQRQQQSTVGQGPGYFALVLNTANSVANAFNLKPASDSLNSNGNANTGTFTGPNTTKYDMKKIADKRPPTVTVSLDDVTGKTGDGEVGMDGNINSSPKSADMLKLQLPESQHALGTGVAQIDVASTYFDTTAPMDVTPDRHTPVNVTKNRPPVCKSQSAVELQSYNDLATPMAKSYSSTTSLGDVEKSQQVSRIRTTSLSAKSDTKFHTFPYNKKDGTGTPQSFISPGWNTIPRPSPSQQRVDTSLPAARNGTQQGGTNRQVADTPVTGSESSANEHTASSSLSSDISISPPRSAMYQMSSGSSSGGPTTEEAALSLPASLSSSAKKRNAEFHTRFKSVPADEMLIDEYTCALSREILVQGKLYVTEHHVCFYANLIGWVTQLVIAFQEIVNIEKKNVLVFPNAIQIETMHSKHFFASFLSRDVAYAKIMECWSSSHSILSSAAYEPLPLTGASSSCSSESIGSYSSNDVSRDSREIDSGEEQDSEEMAPDTEESECSAEDHDNHSTNTPQIGNTVQTRSFTIPPPSTADEVGTDKEAPNTPVSACGSDTSSENGTTLPASSSNATDSNHSKKRRSRHRGLLSRRAGSNGALSMLAASTLGSVVFDTAAAAAAASGKRRRAQTDINSRRREEAAEARRKVNAVKSHGSKPSTTESRPPESVPEKQTAKSEPNSKPPTSAPTTAIPAKHAPTTCPCPASSHGPERVLLLDKVYTAPPMKILTLVFDGGLRASDGKFSKALMETEGGYENIDVGKWHETSTKGEVTAERNLTYDLRQKNPMGPKLVHCDVNEEMLADDPERCFTVRSTVVTPNVPSGNCFSVKLLTCLTWAENEQCRMQVHLWMDWTAKSWIKGMIESKVTEGNKAHYDLLDTELQKYISKHSSEMYDIHPSAGPSTQNEQEPRHSKKKKSRRDRGTNANGALSRKERTSTTRKSKRNASASIPPSPDFLSDPIGYLLSPDNLTRVVLSVVFVVIFLSQTYFWVRLTHLSLRIKEQEGMVLADMSREHVNTVAWRPTVRPFSTVRERQEATKDFARERASTKEEMDAFWDWLADVEGGGAHNVRSKGGGETSSTGKTTSDAVHIDGFTSSPVSPASKQKSHLHEMSKLALATEEQLKRVLEYVEKEMMGAGTDEEGPKPEQREDVPGSESAETVERWRSIIPRI